MIINKSKGSKFDEQLPGHMLAMLAMFIRHSHKQRKWIDSVRTALVEVRCT